MKKILIRICLVGFCLFAAAISIPEDDLLQFMYDQLEKYNTEQPYEKAYVHLDKDYYAAGDDIWLKTYVVSGIDHRPSILSKIVYVEFLDPLDRVLNQLRLKVEKGSAIGDFHLSDSLPSGNYAIRAYTNWMQNQGPEYFYHRDFQVLNARSESFSIKADYTWRKQAAGDSVRVTLQLLDFDNEQKGTGNVEYVLRLGGQTLETDDLRFRGEGEKTLDFFLPKEKGSGNKSLQLEVEMDLGDLIYKDVIALGQRPYCTDLQFFPEGGDWVNGLESRIGVKAIDQYGNGIPIAGTLYNAQDKKVAVFSSNHLGMGSLTLIPESGTSYYARIDVAGRKIREFPLPEALESGYVLSVNADFPRHMEVRVQRSPKMPNELVLAGHVRGNMGYIVRLESPKTDFRINVPKGKFAAGLIHLTLFDVLGRPHAERLAFNPGPEFKVLVLAENETFATRERVDLLIRAEDPLGNPISAPFSLSVTDVGTGPEVNLYPDHIQSFFWLSSDLKGNIEQPAYYFDPKQEQAATHLDELLLTQGWRRFAWKDILSGDFTDTPHLIERNLFISGEAEKLFGKSAKKAKLQLSMYQDSGFVHVQGTSDETGHFYFQEDFTGDRMAVIQGKTKADNQIYHFDIDPVPMADIPARPDFAERPEVFATEWLAFMQNSFERKKVERAYQLATGSYVYELDPITIRGKGTPSDARLLRKEYSDHLMTSEDLDFTNFPNVFELLRSRFPGVTISQNVLGEYTVLLRGFRNLSGGNFALIIIDGIPADAAAAAAIPPSEIASVEVIKGPKAAIYGLRGGNGVVVITTKSAVDDDNKESVGVINFLARGYYAPRQFYAPLYETKLPEHALPDIRSTLYWNPSLYTDADGHARVSFYTADLPTDYQVKVEGLSQQGIPFRGGLKLKVAGE